MNKKYIKIFLFLFLAITGGFSGAFFDKYNLKEKFVNFRYEIYQFFTQENKPDSLNQDGVTTQPKQEEKTSFWARLASDKKDDAAAAAQFDDLKQYAPERTLPAVTNYCHDFLIYGNPSFNVTSGLSKVDLYLCRDGYVAGYNYQTKEPTWVAFKLTSAKVANKNEREDAFREDSDVPFVYRATLSDYKNSGYDRGHLASYASMDFSKKSGYESFLLSNIAPQKAGLNRQGWERLETYERIWANMYQSIYVYTGPIYKKKAIHKTIGDNKVAVPDYFFKIIYVPSTNKAIAFVMPNLSVDKKDVDKYRVSIKSIEERTGLNFLSQISDRDNVIDNVSPMWRTAYS